MKDDRYADSTNPKVPTARSQSHENNELILVYYQMPDPVVLSSGLLDMNFVPGTYLNLKNK